MEERGVSVDRPSGESAGHIIRAWSDIHTLPPTEFLGWCEIRRFDPRRRERLYDSLLAIGRELAEIRGEEAKQASKNGSR